MSTIRLLDLPDDLLIAILVRLNVKDLISIQQTCRVFHAFCTTTDYIWHHIKIDIPLNLPHRANVGTLPGAVLRKLWVAGLRVDDGWRKNPGQLRTLNRIPNGGIIRQMQYIPPNFLIATGHSSTAWQGTTACTLSIWDCEIPSKARLLNRISLETSHLPAFFAALSEDGSHVIVVFNTLTRSTPSTDDALRVYCIPLYDSQFNGDHSAYLVIRIPKSDLPGLVFDPRICGETVSCLIANSTPPPMYRILFLNIRNGKHLIVDVDGPHPFTSLRLFGFPDSYLILVGVERHHTIFLRVYDGTRFLQLLKNMQKDDSSANTELMTLGNPCAKYNCTVEFHSTFEFHSSIGQFNAVVALSFPNHGPNLFIRFPVYSDSDGITRFETHGKPQIIPFHRSTSSAACDQVSFGDWGRRAIWLERRWDFDDPTPILMKAVFPSDGSVAVGPLLPSQTALPLPFQMHTCQCLTLDEAMGRVYVGLYTGDIYILDF